MAPSKGNAGSKNPHMTKRHRFNANTNVPCGHAGCVVAKRAQLDKEKYRLNGNPPKVYTSKAKGMFHVVT